MALVKGLSSYATVNEADLFFADRIDADAWTSANSTKKAQALMTATRLLDELSWIGVAVSEEQSLAFPRSGNYFDPKAGTSRYLNAETPQRVITACYELALHLLTNANLLDSNPSAIDISVGPINLTSVSAPNVIPKTVSRIVRPLLVNAGANPWWRAN
jgi:hypothetical protein